MPATLQRYIARPGTAVTDCAAACDIERLGAGPPAARPRWRQAAAVGWGAPSDTTRPQRMSAGLAGRGRCPEADVCTPRGLPLATWDKATFDSVAQTLDSTFGIPRQWFFEINTYDAADVLGASVGVLSVLFAWTSTDTEAFAKIATNIGLSAAVSANPLLLLVAVVALGRAFHKARRGAEYGQLLDGGVKGGLVAGTTLSAMALVGAASGPLGCSLLVGITAGVVVSAATKNVSVVSVGRFVVSQSPMLLAEAKGAAARSAESVKRWATETRSPLSGPADAGCPLAAAEHETAAEVDALTAPEQH